jgi:hypothetical protein
MLTKSSWSYHDSHLSARFALILIRQSSPGSDNSCVQVPVKFECIDRLTATSRIGTRPVRRLPGPSGPARMQQL